MAFTSPGDLLVLLEELTVHPSPPRQWIGSEAWVTDPEVLRYRLCEGAIGFAIPQSTIPGFREYLLDLSPAKVAASHVLSEFWEGAFNCLLENEREKSWKYNNNKLENVNTKHNYINLFIYIVNHFNCCYSFL